MNYITAAGGLLQSIIFGYGGIRLEPNRLVVHPNHLPNTTGFSLVGIHYRSSILNLHFNGSSNMVIIDVTKPVNVRVRITLVNHALEIDGNNAIAYVSQRAVIEVVRDNTSTATTSYPESTGSVLYWSKGLLIFCLLLTLSNIITI